MQTVTGQVQNVNRNSLFIGGLAATTAPSFAAASPGTGFMPLNGTSAVFRFSDAIYAPMAARRLVAAGRAGVQTAINDAILQVAEAYFDLQQASGRLAIARKVKVEARVAAEVVGAYDARQAASLQITEAAETVAKARRGSPKASSQIRRTSYCCSWHRCSFRGVCLVLIMSNRAPVLVFPFRPLNPLPS
ncbi:MAG TPA: hypothetical protein VKA15_06175 [Isosphaeraceae bacterium]|nr:hypothetical protein [Isosphaeraceae bacterium]